MNPEQVPQIGKTPAELRFGGGWKLLIPFAILPLTIVSAAVGIFFLFGMLADQETSPHDYLERMKSGSQHKKWQAAYELSRILSSRYIENKPELETDILALLSNAKPDETELKRYLIVGLGQVGSEKSVSVLMKLSQKDEDSEVRIFSIWALGRLGSSTATPLLAKLSQSEDAGIRKTSAFSLGFLGGEIAHQRLMELLEDPIQDVRWNAALGLAQLGYTAGAGEISFLLDTIKLEQATPNLRNSERVQIQISAINAVAKLKLISAEPKLNELATTAPDSALRAAARNTLLVIKKS